MVINQYGLNRFNIENAKPNNPFQNTFWDAKSTGLLNRNILKVVEAAYTPLDNSAGQHGIDYSIGPVDIISIGVSVAKLGLTGGGYALSRFAPQFAGRVAANPVVARVAVGTAYGNSLLRSLHPVSPLGARGPISGRDFDPANAGGPIRQLTTNRIKITNRGIDYAEQHLARFGPDPANQGMVQRLRDIASGKLQPTQADVNFYSHELRESSRYKNLGFPSGQPLGVDAAYDLWNNAHTATLEDYLLREGPGVLYHPSMNP